MSRILLVEDDDSVRLVLSDLILKHQNHMSIKAKDGEDGLRLFKEYEPDLLITDIIMPKIFNLIIQ